MVKKIAFIFATFFIATALTIFPLPDWAYWFRPLWVPMVLCCWVLLVPEWESLGIAFLLGLFLDVLTGTLLGEHALLLTLVSFLLTKFQRHMSNYPLVQQTIVVFSLLVCYQAMQYWIQGFVGQLPHTWKFWLPIISSTLLWPWLLLSFKPITQTKTY